MPKPRRLRLVNAGERQCVIETCPVDDQRRPLAPMVRCPSLGMADPNGDTLCSTHREILWTCDVCGAPNPRGDGRGCRGACVLEGGAHAV